MAMTLPSRPEAEPVPSTFETLAVGTAGTVEVLPSLLA